MRTILHVAPAAGRFDDQASLQDVVTAGGRALKLEAYGLIERAENLVKNAIDIC